MKKVKMLVSVTYETDSETKSEIRNDEKQLIDYLEALVDSDFHDMFGRIKFKKITL
jgi:hypothetical protein